MVIEVVFHTLYVLIVLMTLAGNEHYVALFSHHTGCADGFATVYDAYNLLHLLLVKPCQHIVDDGLRVFKARIVAG